MCSKSKLGSLPPMTGTNGGAGSAVQGISAGLVKASPDKYLLLDVTEEVGEESFADAAAKVPLGKLIRESENVVNEPWYNPDKTIVCMCATGVRGQIAAQELTNQGLKATFVNRGILEWSSPAATKPGLVITIKTLEKDQVSVAMSAANASQQSGVQTVVVAMAKGVLLFREKQSGIPPEEIIQDCWAGEPFKNTGDLWAAFRKAGGVTLLCTTCVKNQGIEGKTQDGANLMQLPDLLRMKQEATSSMDF